MESSDFQRLLLTSYNITPQGGGEDVAEDHSHAHTQIKAPLAPPKEASHALSAISLDRSGSLAIAICQNLHILPALSHSRPRAQEGCKIEPRAASIYFIQVRNGVPHRAPASVLGYIHLCAPLQAPLLLASQSRDISIFCQKSEDH